MEQKQITVRPGTV